RRCGSFSGPCFARTSSARLPRVGHAARADADRPGSVPSQGERGPARGQDSPFLPEARAGRIGRPQGRRKGTVPPISASAATATNARSRSRPSEHLPRAGQVTVEIKFDTFAAPRELGLTEDCGKLVLFPPDTVSLTASPRPTSTRGSPAPSRGTAGRPGRSLQ